MKDFCNLHTNSVFSLGISTIKIKDLFQKVKDLGQSSVAISDLSSMAAAHDLLKYSKEFNIKGIIGCEFYFTDDLENIKSNRLRNIVLLATNHNGYKNLLNLTKESFDHNIQMFKKVLGRIDWKLLEKYSQDVICLTGSNAGILGQLISTRKTDQAKEQAKRLKDIFGDRLGLEIQPNNQRHTSNLYHDYGDQKFVNRQMIQFGKELNIKIVAATNAVFLNKEDYEANDVLLAISSGQPISSGNRPKYTPDFYVKSREEVESFFARDFGVEAAAEYCDNSLYFAGLCEFPEWINPKFSNPDRKELPIFPVQNQNNYQEFLQWRENHKEFDNKKEDEVYLRFWCDKGLDKNFPDRPQEYLDRLEEELDVIEFRGFSSYMLIVADILDYCRKNDIPVGKGRGSVGSSLLARLLDIHAVDPIKYNLIFARFQNKDRAGEPDVDLDLSQYGKHLVEQYIVNKYGENKTAAISNYICAKPKPFVRAISRTFEYGGDRKTAVKEGDRLSQTIPGNLDVGLDNLFEKAPLLDQCAEKYTELKKYAKSLIDVPLALSKHAAGWIIGKSVLSDIVPLRRDKEGNLVLQYDKDYAEQNGLIKFDLLGLSTLDIIKECHKILKYRGKPLPPEQHNFDDPKVYELLDKGDTFGVFQLGTSGGTIDLCKKMKARSLEDIAQISAMCRPGFPPEVRADFIEAKHSGQEVKLMHPSLERAFKKTYNFALFEESLMFVGADVAGWDFNEADGLRKFTKEKGKNPEKAKKLKKKFIEDAVSRNGITKEIATKIWEEIIDNFQGYAFNASHAFGYSILSYDTAYLKAHYPLEFLVANLKFESSSNAQSAEDNIAQLKSEIRKLNVKILPPDINKSEQTYKIVDDNTLLTGLDAIKFLGESGEEIVSKRPFNSFEDFLTKVDTKKVRSSGIQALACVGALDSFGLSRKLMYLYASDYKKKLQLHLKKKKDTQFNYPFPQIEDWTPQEKYALEVHYLGECLSVDKFTAYKGFFTKSDVNFAQLATDFPDPNDPTIRKRIRFKGIVRDCFTFRVKKEGSKLFGQEMGKVLLEDPWGNRISLTLFPKELMELPKALKPYKLQLEPGIGLFGGGEYSWYNGELSITYQHLFSAVKAPSLPPDLKSKSVSIKESKIKTAEDLENSDQLLANIEDELIMEGSAEDDEFGHLQDYDFDFPEI